MLIITIVVFVGLLLALVLAHEFGHFIVAKRAGCRVEEFGFGFPPRVWSWKRGDTLYSINLLPIGGFVKIEGEDMDQPSQSPTSFSTKSASWRILILSAGVLMNILLAAVLLSVQAGLGSPTLVTPDNTAQLTDFKTYILEVTPDSPAAEARLTAYDRIVRLDSIEQPTVEEVQGYVREKAGQTITLEIERGGERRQVSVVPRLDPPADEGALGVSLAATGLQRVPWWKTPWHGVVRTGQMMVAIVSQFWFLLQQLIRQGMVSETLTGPIGIAVYTNEVTQLGVAYVLEFAALVSLNLAIVNILPLPALDGGRILFVMIEAIRGKRLPLRYEKLTHTVGFVLLLLLMLAITLKDIVRYF